MISNAQYAELLQRLDDVENDNRFRAHVGALRKEIEDMNKDFYTEVTKGNVPGHRILHKYGKNPDIDTASGFETIWNGGAAYTGFNATAAEVIEVFSSSANDAGTLVSSGTSTGGSATTIIDTGATFVSDGVVVGDSVINDTTIDHGVITAVTETQLTIFVMEHETTNGASQVYRVVTPASTGASFIELNNLLDANYVETTEYVIFNGVTGVDTVGSYIRNSSGKCYGPAVNTGAITVRQKVTTANIFMVLPATYSSTMIAAYTIPAGERAYLVDWFVGLNSKTASSAGGQFMVSPYGSAPQVREEVTANAVGNTIANRVYKSPKNHTMAGSDIHIQADVDTNNTAVVAGFTLLIIQDGY